MDRNLRTEDFVAVNEEIRRLAGYHEADEPEHDWRVCSRYDLKNGLIQPRYGYDLEHFSEWRHYDPLLDTPDLFLRFAKLYDQGLSEVSILKWVHEYGSLGLGQAWNTDLFDGHSEGLLNPLDVPAAYRVLSVLLDDMPATTDYSDPIDGFWEEAVIAAAALKMYEATVYGKKEEAKKLVLFEFPFVELMRGFNRSWWKPIAEDYFGEHLTNELQAAILTGVREANDFATRNREATTNFIMHFHLKFGRKDFVKTAFPLSVQIIERRVQALCYPKSVLAASEGEYSFTNLKPGWGYRNLLGAMYLQMHWLVTSGKDVARCEHCEGTISLAKAPVPGARKPPRHKRFCNEYCRYNHYYQTKKKPAREEDSSS